MSICDSGHAYVKNQSWYVAVNKVNNRSSLWTALCRMQMGRIAVREGVRWVAWRGRVLEGLSGERAPTIIMTNIWGCQWNRRKSLVISRENILWSYTIQHLITSNNLRPAYIKLPVAVLKVHKSGETCTDCFVLQFWCWTEPLCFV
jgi:hypothetical protein